MSYEPTVNSIAWKALQHLKQLPPGAELTTSAPNTPEPGPQQVLKAEPATADATARGAPDIASPDGGPVGVWQPAAAGPLGEPLRGRTATVSMTGEVAVVAECGTVILFDAERARQLRAFFGGLRA